MKYHKVTVTMKNGFTYSYVCIGKMLESMKKSSLSFWTEKVESVEITSEAYYNFLYVDFEEHEVKKEKPRSEAPEKKSGKAKTPKFSSLEDFFDSSEPAPKNKKLKKRV